MNKISLKLLPEKTDDSFSSEDLLGHLTNQVTSFCNEQKMFIDLIEKSQGIVNEMLLSVPEKAKVISEEIKAIRKHYSESIRAVSEFEKLSNAISFCREASDSKNIDEVALSFYLLGINSSTIESGIYGDLKDEMINAYHSKQKQVKSLNDKKETVDFFKLFSKFIASEAWVDSPSIRITTMAEHVLARLNKKGSEPFKGGQFRDSIPTIATIKKWIREIAPAQASARGRPSKK
jgi:hypothetical protein